MISEPNTDAVNLGNKAAKWFSIGFAFTYEELTYDKRELEGSLEDLFKWTYEQGDQEFTEEEAWSWIKRGQDAALEFTYQCFGLVSKPQ